MKSIAVYDSNFQRLTYLGDIVSFIVTERRSTYGDYNVWLKNNKEITQYLIEGNFIIFQHGVEDITARNLLSNGSKKYGVTDNGDEFNSLTVYSAYPLTPMSSYNVQGKNVVLSCDYEALTDVELNSGAQIWLQLEYSINGVASQLNVKCETNILSAQSGHEQEIIQFPSTNVSLIRANVIISGVNGTVNIFNAKLEIGSTSTSYSDSPETDFSYTGINLSAGFINKVEYQNNDEFSGIIVSGNLCESFIEDRCLYGLFSMTDTPIAVCNQMILENFVNPTDVERDYEIVDVAEQSVDTDEPIFYQKTGFQVAEAILDIILNRNIGLKVLFDSAMKKLHFYLYKGKDRSSNQSENARIIFSDESGLLINPSYIEDYTKYKNVAMIAGEDSGADRVFTLTGNATGKNRKELYVDARDLQSELDDGTLMTPEEYIEILVQRGNEKLAVLQPVTSFTSDVTLSVGGHIYGKDYVIGDKVTLHHSTTGIRIDAIVEEVSFVGDSNGDEMSIVFGYSPPSIAKLIRSRFS